MHGHLVHGSIPLADSASISDLYDSWSCVQITAAGAPSVWNGNPGIPAIFSVTSTGCCKQSSGSCDYDFYDSVNDEHHTVSDCDHSPTCTSNPDITVAAVEPHVVPPGDRYAFPPAQVSKARAQPTKCLHSRALLG